MTALEAAAVLPDFEARLARLAARNSKVGRAEDRAEADRTARRLLALCGSADAWLLAVPDDATARTLAAEADAGARAAQALAAQIHARRHAGCDAWPSCGHRRGLLPPPPGADGGHPQTLPWDAPKRLAPTGSATAGAVPASGGATRGGARDADAAANAAAGGIRMLALGPDEPPSAMVVAAADEHGDNPQNDGHCPRAVVSGSGSGSGSARGGGVAARAAEGGRCDKERASGTRQGLFAARVPCCQFLRGQCRAAGACRFLHALPRAPAAGTEAWRRADACSEGRRCRTHASVFTVLQMMGEALGYREAEWRPIAKKLHDEHMVRTAGQLRRLDRSDLQELGVPILFCKWILRYFE
jgi:hypothetical protein